MSDTNKALKRLENKVNDIEKFIEERGLGSEYLERAKTVQRDVNLALVIGGAIGLVGVSVWAMLKD